MQTDLTVAEVHARIRWVRMCMALIAIQEDMAAAREIAAAAPRKPARWYGRLRTILISAKSEP